MKEQLETILNGIRELRASIAIMEARGERISAQVEDKLHELEEEVAKLVRLVKDAKPN